MPKALTILLVTGLVTLQSCSGTTARRPGKRDFCQLAPEQGRCRGSISKWFYDSSSGECTTFTYGGCGGNANKFLTKSLCERVCTPGCRYETCSTPCSGGYIIDSDGCNTCRCQPSPAQASCPAIECPDRCPHGYQTDSNGCTTCDCRAEQVQTRVISRTSPAHQCPPVCYMLCQYGNKQDEHGCDVCLCKSKEEACGSQQCMMECPTGLVVDSKGCEVCECNNATAAPSCPTNQCLKECTSGFQTDSFGCEICACATRRSRNRKISNCSSRPICSKYCPNGFLKGRDGCDICVCAWRHTARHAVRPQRRFGKGPSSEDVCGVRPMCMMHCEHGFVKDSKGCDTCNCNQAPPVNAVQFPASVTGNTADTPAQIPANFPSQPAADVLPVEVPAQLPADTECTRKRCHKFARCAFGFAKDEFGCDTCVCGRARSRASSNRLSDQ